MTSQQNVRSYNFNKQHSIKPLILLFEEHCRAYHISNDGTNIARTPPRLPPWFDLTQLCDLSLTPLKKKHTAPDHIIQEFRIVQDKYKGYTEVYTDGSKTKNHVGVRIVMEENAITIRVPQLMSIFSAEVYALWEAVREIITGKYKKAVIYTDSLSSLKATTCKISE